jgi:tetratricopeptide (TPR) repeat protein
MQKEWRTFTPRVFAAGLVAVTNRVPGLRLVVAQEGTEDAPPVAEQLLRHYALAQVRSWQCLIASWLSDETYGSSLEDDLRRYVDPGVILPGAPEILSERLDELHACSDVSDTARYVWEAVHASVCAAAQEPNASASRWAQYFFFLEVACRLAEDDVPPRIEAMRISEERARKTVDRRGAWNAVARRAAQMSGTMDDPDQYAQRLQYLDEVASKAGHPSLVTEVMETQEEQALLLSGDVSVDALIERMRAMVARFQSSENVLRLFRPEARVLVAQHRLDDLERLADAALELMGGSRDAQAHVETWLGSYLKEARAPERFLDRVGEAPRPWEHDLTARRKIDLWTERSNALRILGRLDEALQIAREVVGLFDGIEDPKNRRMARRNLAILLRDTGSPDAALSSLHDLLEEAEDGNEKINILESLIATYMFLGRPREALPCVDAALELADGPLAHYVPRLRAYRASVLTPQDLTREAAETLSEIDLDEDEDPVTVLSQVGCWMSILQSDPSLGARDRFTELYKRLDAILEQAERRGDTQIALAVYEASAWVHEILDSPHAREYLKIAYDAYEQARRPQDPAVLISQARYAYERGDAVGARSYLKTVPAALAASLGKATDLAVVLEATHQLPYALNKLTEVVLFDPRVASTWEDRRLVSELHRDAIGRARLARPRFSADDPSPAVGLNLSDEAIGRLAPNEGVLGIVEWVSTHKRGIGGFVTFVADTGEISSHWLTVPNVNMRALAKRMRNRLRNWFLGRPGDPFDLPEWQELERWLVQHLSPHLQSGDHVVFLEHEEYAGLPWHVAASSSWTSSYAAGWSVLFSFGENPSPVDEPTVGVVRVPRYGESGEVLEVLKTSERHAKELAAAQRLSFVSAVDGEGDEGNVRRVREEADVAKLLCHGFVDTDGEVAFMLARDGSLPLADSVVAGGEVGRRHRLSWRELQRLPASPRSVFSAACSSGVTRTAGLGERLGLFNALRRSGTRSMVAPWWNVDAEYVLPILDHVFERYVRGGEPLGRALHAACAAANDRPRRHAWALALEGDWR